MKNLIVTTGLALGLMAGAAHAQKVADLGYQGLDPASGKAPQQLVVLFHGYSQKGEAMKPLAEALAKRLPNAAFVFNDAPMDAGQGKSWYVLRGPDPTNTKAAAKTLAADTVKKAEAGLKVKPENTVVIGFSQGGGVAFDGASCSTPNPKAFVSLAGILANGDCKAPAGAKPMAVLIVRDDMDPTVPIDRIHAFQDQLKADGYDASHLEQVSGNTHYPQPEGIQKAVDFVVAQLGGK